MVKLSTSTDKFKERECPNCKEKVIPFLIEHKTLDFENFKGLPERFKGVSYYPSIYILGCPECKSIFYDYRD